LIQAVFLDVGETIVDESREYGTWADWLGVPRHTFSAVMGAVIARGQDYRETFQVFRPGFNLGDERRRRTGAGQPEGLSEENLYADARPCLQALRSMGLVVGLAGNQTKEAGAALVSLALPVDVIGTSDAWEVEKPSPEFFARVVEEAGCDRESILYVGDRLDNDIGPAQKAGLATALIRRGPWGYILHDATIEAGCLFELMDLSELPEQVSRFNEGNGYEAIAESGLSRSSSSSR
jgi:HAD superfamily hydrolase (TIGR01549 family)